MEKKSGRKKKTSMLRWELDVSPLISTKSWLKNYGLKKNKLNMYHILPAIGFKLSDDYDTTLKRPVASRYGSALFQRAFRKDGHTYNLKCSKDKLIQIQNRLKQVLRLFERRLSWLTSESRRTFGVIEEKCVTVVLDIKNLSPQQFNQFIGAFQMVLEEQISRISKFNLIRSAENMKLFRESCVPVTHDTIYEAIEWIKSFDRLEPISSTAPCEAVVEALKDTCNEAVYILTEGTSIDACRGVFIEQLTNSRPCIPVNVVSYNCDNLNTIQYLKRLAECTKGRFHAYAVTMEMVTYDDDAPENGSNGDSQVLLKRNMYGGMPEGAGIREDVLILFEEFEEARNTNQFIEDLIKEGDWDPPKKKDEDPKKATRKLARMIQKKESSMGSAEWLKRYGLEANKLEFHDALAKVTFDHIEGVTNSFNAPQGQDKKLVDAIYCETLFPAVRWTDGTIKHVIVTQDIHRTYEQRVTIALNRIQERIKWLTKGSRALFGTIIEDNIYILIDCSKSMEENIKFVKEKVQGLIQEQLRHKKSINVVSFGTTVETWSSRLVDITPQSLHSAQSWINALSCTGSTNTYGAIQYAISDSRTDGIYLLTDGCPDQPPKSIIAQVLMQNRLPIHTIAFNCNNTDANNFLYELACATGGRFHHFSEYYVDDSQPQPWVSEDYKLLKQEYDRGVESLKKIAKLRDECQAVYWNNAIQELKNRPARNPRDRNCVHTSRLSHSSSIQNTFPFKTLPRPKSAPPPKIKHDPKPPTASKYKRRRTKTGKSRKGLNSSSKTDRSKTDTISSDTSASVNISDSMSVEDSTKIETSIDQSNGDIGLQSNGVSGLDLFSKDLNVDKLNIQDSNGTLATPQTVETDQ